MKTAALAAILAAAIVVPLTSGCVVHSDGETVTYGQAAIDRINQVSTATVSGPPLSNSDVVARGRALSPSSDPFAPPPTDDLTGHKFEISLPIPMKGAGRDEPLYWTYDRATQTLRVEFYPSNLRGDAHYDGAFSTARGFTVDAKEEGMEVFEGMNAYGAKTQAARVREDNLAVAQVETGLRDRLPGNEGAFYAHNFEIEPELARTISASLTLVLTGQAVGFGGRPVICGRVAESATLTRPIQREGRQCIIPVRFASFAIVDGRNGTILKEWSR